MKIRRSVAVKIKSHKRARNYGQFTRSINYRVHHDSARIHSCSLTWVHSSVAASEIKSENILFLAKCPRFSTPALFLKRFFFCCFIDSFPHFSIARKRQKFQTHAAVNPYLTTIITAFEEKSEICDASFESSKKNKAIIFKLKFKMGRCWDLAPFPVANVRLSWTFTGQGKKDSCGESLEQLVWKGSERRKVNYDGAGVSRSELFSPVGKLPLQLSGKLMR